MKYTLLVVLTRENETYKSQLEDYLSKVECIEEIRYLILNSQKTIKVSDCDESLQENIKVSVKSVFSKDTYISRLQNSVKDLKDKYLMVLPQALLPSVKFFEYASNVLDDTTGALILGLHDNKTVSKDELLNPKENYTIYTVFNKKPSEHDGRSCN